MNNEKLTMNNEKKYGLPAFFFFLFSLFSFLFVLSCRTPFDPPELGKPADGTGNFSLAIDGVRTSRTILPKTVLDNFGLYKLEFSPAPSNGNQAFAIERGSKDISDPINLGAGTWDLSVTAYINSELYPAAQGNLKGIVIGPGANASHKITLDAIIDGGAGTYKWNVSYPANVTTASMTITPLSENGTHAQTRHFSGSHDAGELRLNAGYYRVVFFLMNDNQRCAEWREILHVYQNLESVFEHEFEDYHFNNFALRVTNNNDSGPGSLRQAMADAPDGSIIVIDIPAGSQIAVGQTLNVAGKSIDIITESGITIRRAAGFTGYIFDIYEGGVLTLGGAGEEMTIMGNESGNNYSLIMVSSSGELIMDEEVTITGNTASNIFVGGGVYYFVGGGVYVNYGTFTMNGGEISGNTASYGGGVHVNYGTFAMNGGQIVGNHATAQGSGVYVNNGGTFTMNGGQIAGNHATGQGSGVYVGSDGTFTMEGGTISNNTANNQGGGVYVYDNGTFTMNGGEISGNTANYEGGGVYETYGTFTMNGGTISGNTAESGSGGGVYSGTFTMNGGTISGNTANDAGGGVFSHTFTMSNGTISDNTASYGGGVISNGIFTMSNGTISGNTANESGGGVYSGGTFTMEGGTISGNTANDAGGGVYEEHGTFTLNNGTISGNAAVGNGGGVYSSGGMYSTGTFAMNGGTINDNSAAERGGGVCVWGGQFNMKSGTVSNNTADCGGGLAVVSVDFFTISGGQITGNHAVTNGGGVSISLNKGRSFNMNGGEITGNDAIYNGGGVYVESGKFTLSNNGIISNNKASAAGGGVAVMDFGTFSMNGGTISKNTACDNSGGVFVQNGCFTKTGGTIYGYNAQDTNSNVVRDDKGTVLNDKGHAVHAHANSAPPIIKRKETTAGPNDNLSFDGTVDPPTWSGDWDDLDNSVYTFSAIVDFENWLKTRANNTQQTPYNVAFTGLDIETGLNGICDVLVENKYIALDLSGCTGARIPSFIGEYNNNPVVSLVLPNTLTTIEHSAFWYFQYLDTVSLPASIQSVDAYAFAMGYPVYRPTFTVTGSGQCYTLEEGKILVIGTTIVSAPAMTGSYTIPNNITHIQQGAFYHSGLTSITLHNTIQSIGAQAFMSNDLASVSLPASLQADIDWMIFDVSNINLTFTVNGSGRYSTMANGRMLMQNSTELIAWPEYSRGHGGDPVIPENITAIGSLVFYGSEITSVSLPDSLITIGDQAFSTAYNLTQITLPAGLTSIGNYAFRICQKLEQVICLAQTPPVMGYNVFEDIPPSLQIKVPANRVNAYRNAPGWNLYADRIGPIESGTGTANITVSLWPDKDSGVFTIDKNDLTISGPQSFTAMMSAAMNGAAVTNFQCIANGLPVTVNANERSITVNAAHYSPGKYSLTVIAWIGGMPYSGEIRFTVQ